jgi:hypothetical protein
LDDGLTSGQASKSRRIGRQLGRELRADGGEGERRIALL